MIKEFKYHNMAITFLEDFVKDKTANVVEFCQDDIRDRTLLFDNDEYLPEGKRRKMEQSIKLYLQTRGAVTVGKALGKGLMFAISMPTVLKIIKEGPVRYINTTGHSRHPQGL